jgi:hypothetical protein
MEVKNAFNLIVQVVLTRATGNAQEIDAWRQALQELQKTVQPELSKEVKEEVKK